MSNRIEPDTLSWTIRADSIFQDEVAFHGSDGDVMLVEEFDPDTETWILCEKELRFTIYRDTTPSKEATDG